MISPSAVTISRARTAVERLPLLTPEPWVAVAIAPATVMCGQRGEVVDGEALGVDYQGRGCRSGRLRRR
jgi:hypothetical protein